MTTFESTLQGVWRCWLNSQRESVLRHIILNLNPNNRADHISQPAQRLQNPSEYAGALSLSFSQVGVGQSTIYWCWHLFLHEIRIQSYRASLKPQLASVAATISPRGLKCWLFNISFPLKPWALRELFQGNYKLYRQWHTDYFGLSLSL